MSQDAVMVNSTKIVSDRKIQESDVLKSSSKILRVHL